MEEFEDLHNVKYLCPFCNFKHLTKWYYCDKEGIVVCEDLNKRQYKMRLLVVGVGKPYHHACKCIKEIVQRYEWLGLSVARALIKNKECRRVVAVDKEHFAYPEHCHIQICLE